MASKSRAKNGKWGERYLSIAPYVSFELNPNRKFTTKTRRKITKYHNEISALLNRPHQIYKPTGKNKKKNLAAVQKFSGHVVKLPQLKVAFVPTDGRERVKIKISKKGKVTLKGKYVSISDIEFDLNELLDDAEGHIEEKLATSDGEKFTISVGKGGRYEIPHDYTKSRLPSAVTRLMNKYNDADKNNYWERWLHGAHVYNFSEQADSGAYFDAKSEAINKAKTKRANKAKNDKRRLKRLRAKGK